MLCVGFSLGWKKFRKPNVMAANLFFSTDQNWSKLTICIARCIYPLVTLSSQHLNNKFLAMLFSSSTFQIWFHFVCADLSHLMSLVSLSILFLDPFFIKQLLFPQSSMLLALFQFSQGVSLSNSLSPFVLFPLLKTPSFSVEKKS